MLTCGGCGRWRGLSGLLVDQPAQGKYPEMPVFGLLPVAADATTSLAPVPTGLWEYLPAQPHLFAGAASIVRPADNLVRAFCT